MMGIFRRESVDPTFGYTFDPIQMRRLFNAGAEEVRVQCFDVARFLGMGDAVDGDPAKVQGWCNETPEEEQGLCPAPEDEEYRVCESQPEKHGR
jgi:hypothetical protein